jgi:transglutaminase-like putative cysteine protease
LAAKLTAGLTDPIAKAKAIYDYITENVDYRYQPSYTLLDPISDQCSRDLRGDCGMFAILFITLCRLAGIPAKWQSGLSVEPDSAGAHDWAMFYVAPHGWLWADCSYGSSSRREGNESRRTHYFGNLDPWRMVCNSEFQAPLCPPMTGWRNDPFDNQSGEIMVDGEGLTFPNRETSIEVLEFKLI